MRVCIDIQSVIKNPTGVGRYTLELVKALANLSPHLPAEYRVPREGFENFLHPRGNTAGYSGRWGDKKADITLSYFNFLGRYNGPDYFPNKEIRIMPGRVYNQLWKRFHFPPLNWFIGNYDIYHFPNFCLPPMTHGKFIITVHDLAFMRYPEYIEPKNLEFLRRELPSSLKSAHRIIAVSHFTKKELIELFNVPEEKIAVIYEGVVQSFALNTFVQSEALNNYILCVSTIEPRKNIEGLIQAARLCNMKLVIVGQKGWMTDIKPEKDVIFLGYVPEKELYNIYRNAKSFVFPSFYEGFGLPPLEAMAYGVPVVSTKFEVLGDAARFVDPRDPEDIANGVKEVLADPGPWVKKGLEQVKKFSWQKTAEETFKLYEDCYRL